ncbi:MAG: hypothetical protein K2J61_05270, partial [Clostridia bacterium]|nr:hypothetical protein [Clostridia bacterium]
MDAAESIKIKLDGKGIHSLRQIGRVIGVSFPTKKKKSELIDDIIAIAKNEVEPCPRSTRGAPPKSEDYDADIVDEINECRKLYTRTAAESATESPSYKPLVASDEEEELTYSGVLEFTDKFWFVRTNNMQITSANDV